MILEMYDMALIGGVVLGLIIFYFELKILFNTHSKSSLTSGLKIKAIAILGLLFLMTAIIAGSALSNYLTKETITGGVTAIGQNVNKNDQNVILLKEQVSQLKQGLSTIQSIEDRNRLLHQINLLEAKISDLQEVNKYLRNDIDDLEDELRDIYAFTPGTNY